MEAYTKFREEREIGIELLMTIAAFVAGALGMWGEAATLAFLYSVSESLEEFTEDRIRGAIRALMDLAPKRVVRLVDGREEEIGLEDLAVGDRFIVRPGEGVAVPLAARLVRGQSVRMRMSARASTWALFACWTTVGAIFVGHGSTS